MAEKYMVEMRKIENVKSYGRNPRKNDKAVDAVARSIQEFGFRQPIVIDREGIIIVGHTRWKAAKKLGLTEVPVHIATDLTEAQKKAYRIADNKTNELADWDLDSLPLELIDLRDLNFDLGNLGFGEGELDALLPVKEGLTDPDEIPEPPAEPITKRGDLWLLSEHRVLCGDSTRTEDVKRLMNGKKANLIVTDPPYAVNYIGGRTAGGAKIRRDGERYWDDMTPEAYSALLTSALENGHEHSEDSAALYLWFASVRIEEVLTALDATCWMQRNLLAWVKNTFTGSLFAQFKHQFEPFFYCHKTGKSPRWYGPNNETTVWQYDKPHKNEGHPTVKPLALIERAIRNSSARGDVVLDLFLGSGTTIIAAERMERVGYGLEIEPRYCDVVVKRWENFVGKKAERINV